MPRRKIGVQKEKGKRGRSKRPRRKQPLPISRRTAGKRPQLKKASCFSTEKMKALQRKKEPGKTLRQKKKTQLHVAHKEKKRGESEEKKRKGGRGRDSSPLEFDPYMGTA